MKLQARMTGLAFDGVLVFLFGCVLIGAGHGVGPIGLLMIVGNGDPWGLPMLVGWLGIAGLALAPWMMQREAYAALIFLGQALLVTSWCLFLSESASVVSSLVFSIPFLGALVGRLVLLLLHVRTGKTA